jgi:hypothetical protein
VQWWFESTHGHHRLVAQLADAARSDRADRGSNPREPTIPSVAEMAYAVGPNPTARPSRRAMWVRIPPLGPFWGGHSRRERLRVVSAAVRVRVPLSSPEWARRSTGGSLACTQGMRVRFPPGPPHRGRCGGKGRRPWRSHKPRHAGSIPASATRAGSFNGRTAVLQTAHGGSIPSPATRSVVSEGKRRAARL